MAGVQLHPALPPEHPGEPATVHVPSHHGRILPPQAGRRRWLGLDCWQVGTFSSEFTL